MPFLLVFMFIPIMLNTGKLGLHQMSLSIATSFTCQNHVYLLNLFCYLWFIFITNSQFLFRSRNWKNYKMKGKGGERDDGQDQPTLLSDVKSLLRMENDLCADFNGKGRFQEHGNNLCQPP